MALDQVARLFREARVNPSLREQLNTSPTPEDFVRMAQQYGYEFTLDEWRASTRFAVEELKCHLSEIPGI